MPQDHKCEVEERKRLKRESQQKTAAGGGGAGRYTEAMQKAAAKLNPTAMKVQVMRLKMHSQVIIYI